MFADENSPFWQAIGFIAVLLLIIDFFVFIYDTTASWFVI